MENFDGFLSKYQELQVNGYHWKLLDDAITSTTAKYPNHDSYEQVISKVLLVNRTYRANIQMAGSGAENKLARYLVQKESDLDELVIKPLESIDRFERASMHAVVDANNALTNLVHEAIGLQAVSFVSKYLSFHFSETVPIYDRRARASLRKTTGNRMRDLSYRPFCDGIASILEALEANGINEPSLKLVDVVLFNGLD